MEKIYSLVEKDKLLHIITRLKDITFGRRDLSDPGEFLQIATINMELGKTFNAHKHIWKNAKSTCIAQESWIVISGSVKVILYDVNDKIIKEDTLMPGDASITFYGGHNYIALEENTIVYEVKSSRYEGIEKDKVKI
jgi:hypothetical protein